MAQEARVTATREETFRALFDENPQAMMVTKLPGTGPVMATCPSSRSTVQRRDVRLQSCGVPDTHASRSVPPRIAQSARTNLHAMRGGRTHFEGIRHSTKTGERARRRDGHSRDDLRRRGRDDRLRERRHRPYSPAARARASGLSRRADRTAESFALRRSARTCSSAARSRDRLLRGPDGGSRQFQDGE